MLPEIVRAAAEPMGNIDNLTVLSTDGASDMVKNVTRTVTEASTTVKGLTGIDIPDMLNKALATRSSERAVRRAAQATSGASVQRRRAATAAASGGMAAAPAARTNPGPAAGPPASTGPGAPPAPRPPPPRPPRPRRRGPASIRQPGAVDAAPLPMPIAPFRGRVSGDRGPRPRRARRGPRRPPSTATRPWRRPPPGSPPTSGPSPASSASPTFDSPRSTRPARDRCARCGGSPGTAQRALRAADHRGADRPVWNTRTPS